MKNIHQYSDENTKIEVTLVREELSYRPLVKIEGDQKLRHGPRHATLLQFVCFLQCKIFIAKIFFQYVRPGKLFYGNLKNQKTRISWPYSSEKKHTGYLVSFYCVIFIRFTYFRYCPKTVTIFLIVSVSTVSLCSEPKT